MVFGPKTQPDIYSGWNYFDLQCFDQNSLFKRMFVSPFVHMHRSAKIRNIVSHLL